MSALVATFAVAFPLVLLGLVLALGRLESRIPATPSSGQDWSRERHAGSGVRRSAA